MAKTLPKVKSGPGVKWTEGNGIPSHRRGKVLFDPGETRVEAAAMAAQAAADEAASREAELYDNYSLREIANATAVKGFRRREKFVRSGPKAGEKADRGRALARAVRVSDQAAEVRHKALDEADRLRAAVDNPRVAVPQVDVSQRIRQGVKAAVETVPMPVRLEVAQVRMLKVLAAQDGTTASAIIRACIKQHLEQRAAQDPAFADAARAALRDV